MDFLVSFAKEQGVGVILSTTSSPALPSLEEIVDILREEQSCGADIAAGGDAQLPEDVLTLLCATNQMETQYAEIPSSPCPWGNWEFAAGFAAACSAALLPLVPDRTPLLPGRLSVKELRKSLLQVHGEMGA